jgi:hypothetical protein
MDDPRAAMSRASLGMGKPSWWRGGMDVRDADRASPIGAALRRPASRGAGAATQTPVIAMRDRAAGTGHRGGGGQRRALRADRRLPAGGGLTQVGAGHGGGDLVAIGRKRSADRPLPPGGASAVDAGGSVVARASGQGRGAITGRAGTAFVPQQELGVAPAGAAQSSRTRDAGQGCGWTDPSASGDEVSVAVGPGQPSTRQRAGRGTWRAASLGAAGGTTVGCVPRCGPGRTGTALRIAATISADGGAGRTRGTGPSRRHRAPTGGPGRHRGAVRSRPAARAEGALRRGIGAGTGKDLGRADRSAWGDGDAGRRAFGEARL